MNAATTRSPFTRPLLVAAGAAALLWGGGLIGEQAWLTTKAGVARVLIDRAYSARLVDGDRHLPWRWADTYPVARLEVPRLGVRRTVLAGATGASLAFGPGHVDGTAPPNSDGNCVLAGHRDSWFAFLERLHPGDEVRLETFEGTRLYRVRDLEVRSMWDTEIVTAPTEDRLTLVTCYPFRSLRRSEQRFVVTLVQASELISRVPRKEEPVKSRRRPT